MSPTIAEGSFAVIGGASLIGSTIGRLLLEGGARDVVLVDDFSLGRRDSIAELEVAGARVAVADITRPEELLPALEGVDGAFHAAALLTSRLAETPGRGIDVNMRGTLSVLEACRANRLRKVVLSSTIGVYGTSAGTIDEDTPFAGRGMHAATALYSLSKLVSETLCALYRERHGLDYLSLRYSTVYGPGLHRRGQNSALFLDAYERLSRGLPPILAGHGEDRHDYIYVDDVASANLAAMERPISGEVITIATGVPTSTRRALEVFVQQAGAAHGVELRDGPGSMYTPPEDTRYDVGKAERLLGWSAQVDLVEGMRRLADSLAVAQPV